MSTPLDIADRLEAARQASGLTRQALTEKAGVSRQAVYRLLKGQDVQVSTLLAVMDVLQLDLVTVPRALERGLPELRTAAEGNPSHALSAVQQRLARIKEGQR
ncbi:helix-turn-helix domain-containing protein [Variovorax guangxiensis]|uniref:XRE family transcriptional regulator n=1 Tax=Variovorax guangxiensis TaxID=1775474 RepID=A0A502E2Y5_9BURK|nr:helix-turn-helix transcriptional regulator [Variovorax guangxiensis]TPG27062.1 XRE family transcriptional regulator [Variovorax ginsengisoli]TPG30790.1 XRE family transcriptional regulator [Variovorax guangxiensis]